MPSFARSCFALFACAPSLLGCSDEPDAQSDVPICAGLSNPAVIELTELEPALGASVPNEAIVHSFTITGDVAFTSIAFAYSKLHDAGDARPALELTYSNEASGVVYTSGPTSWENAPSHVEMAVPLVYETAAGCAYTLPVPLFSYDVTAP
jgi:hypothetical protein